jgi:uncharacterized protein YndB with AHSA1/START domain
MPQPSSKTALPAPTHPTHQDGPILEFSSDPGERLRIRAHRTYPVSREELFGAWTQRNALDVWLRLRSRSRVMLAPQLGGPFRLELAEGPTIHVITGAVLDIRPSDSLTLSWVHHAKGDQASSIVVTFYEFNRRAQLSLLHRGIESRREAAWLMQLWLNALGRLGRYFSEGASLARSA